MTTLTPRGNAPRKITEVVGRDYIVVTGERIVDIEQAVNDKLKVGYDCLGPLIVDRAEGYVNYYQTMIRHTRAA